MGFNLQLFLDDLQEIIVDRELDEPDKLQQLEDCITSARKYAETCGEIE